MKVIILAGGYGTRLSEYTDLLPKPMVTVGDRPILWHLMNIFSHFDHSDFYIALGYKAHIIKSYFLNYRLLNSDFSINLDNGLMQEHDMAKNINWNVTLVHTGDQTMTGGRVKRMKKYIGNETFLLTYGDGLSNININKLIDFHRSHGKMVTVSAVRPVARFGELELEDSKVLTFREKSQLDQGWINGGFFVIEPSFFDLIESDNTMLEREPLEIVSSMGELMAFKHDGFWQCMDTKRDHEVLENLWSNGAPWLFNDN